MRTSLAVALIAILIIALTWMAFKNHGLEKDLGITTKQLKRKDRDYATQIDSLKRSVEYWKTVADTWADSTTGLKIVLRVSERKTAAAAKKYEDLKNSPVVRYTDQQLDSIVFSIVRQP